MKLESIVVLYEAKVAEYVNKGYAVDKRFGCDESWVNYHTYLINGEETVRVSLTNVAIGDWDVHYKASGLKLAVTRYVRWCKQGEIESRKWYKITNDWYVTEDDSKMAFQKRYNRFLR